VNVAKNLVRVALAGVLTVLVGTPMLAVIYSTYIFGLISARVGRKEMLDRVIAWNTKFAGNIAQRYWARLLLKLVRVRVATRGKVDWDASHVLCANHASIFDILALIAIIPPPFRFVAKRELLKWPIIGWALHPSGQIVINRSDRSGAVRKLEEEAAREIDGQVIFFVEGTRTRTGELLPFKKGAFYFSIEHSLPVLPTAITGSFGVLAKVPWWRLHPGRDIEIVFGREIAPPGAAGGEARHNGVQQLLDATREQIAAALAQHRESTAIRAQPRLANQRTA
jgi:1-acyl-sn-glycerol-3-phosphate acyltransferase